MRSKKAKIYSTYHQRYLTTTRRKFSSEEKIKIALEGFHGDESIAMCRRESFKGKISKKYLNGMD